MQDNKIYYETTYLPKIIKVGRWTLLLAAIMVCLPPIVVTWVYGVVPDWTPLLAALIAQISINGVWAVIEPVSYFPVLGIAGTYMSFLSGDIGNLRIPCASAALKATNTKVGTKEAAVISSIGISASVVVNLVMLIAGVILGSQLIANLPPQIKESLSFLLPAMFGALLMQFAVDDVKSGLVAMALGCGSFWIYNAGGYNWFPIDPFIPNMLLPIFGTMLFARLTYRPAKEDEQATADGAAGISAPAEEE